MKLASQMIITSPGAGSRERGDELSVLIKWFCEILHISGMSQTSRLKETTTYEIVISSVAASKWNILSSLKPVNTFQKNKLENAEHRQKSYSFS